MTGSVKIGLVRLLVLVGVLLCAGCQSPGQIAAGIVGGTVAGGIIPGNGLEQIYYLGIFDPRDQIPQTFYRVTVRGQASVINTQTRFASGWVPAALIDGLGTDVDAHLKGGEIKPSGDSTQVPELVSPVKRMFLLGPEGIRVSPASHRLVIVMGSSPEGFFEAVDAALGTLSSAEVSKADGQAQQAITNEYRRLQDELAELQTIRLRMANEAVSRAREAQ